MIPIKRGDFIVLAGLALALAASGAWYAFGRAAATSGTDLVVVCQSKSGFYRTDPLSADVTYEVETPGTGTGRDADEGVNTVRIHDGAVEVESANCENQLCVHHDPVSKAGEQIVCLPHGVVVQVARSENDVAKLS